MRFGPLSLLLAAFAGRTLAAIVTSAASAAAAPTPSPESQLATDTTAPPPTIREAIELTPSDFHEKTAKGYW